MYYLIDNDEDLKYYDISDVLDYCVTQEYFEEDTDSFCDYLNQDGNIDVSGYEFEPSDILYTMNSDAYYQELRYWAENQVESSKGDYEYELERALPGSSVYVCGYQVYVYEDENESDEEELSSEDYSKLEEKIARQKQDETRIKKEAEKTENDFLSALGIQVI